MDNPVLKIADVEFSYEGDSSPTLKNLNIKIFPGERLSIVGPGGSGKSTLLKIILGLLKPQKGSVHLLGFDMVHGSEKEKLKILSKVGMAFQQGALFDFMTVEENLQFSMIQASADKDEMSTRITDLLAKIKLPHTPKMFPHELSGGMQRRIGIARAVAAQPDVVLFDEPTSGLDPVTSSIIIKMIQAITDEISASQSSEVEEKAVAKTAVMASSAIDMAMRFADRMIVLRDNEVIADQSWRKLIIGDDPWIRHFLSARLIGVDRAYVEKLGVPPEFLAAHFS